MKHHYPDILIITVLYFSSYGQQRKTIEKLRYQVDTLFQDQKGVFVKAFKNHAIVSIINIIEKIKSI